MSYDGRMVAYVASGTHAARPASPNISPGTASVYYETDTTNSFIWTGSAWVQLNGVGGSGAVTKIARTGPLGASAATINLSSIPGTYSHLLIVYSARTTSATNYQVMQVQCNGDTGANYDYQYLHAQSATTAPGGTQAAASMILGEITGGSANANVFSAGQILIANYSSASIQKSASASAFFPYGTGQPFLGQTGGIWHSTAAITSVLLTPAAGSFDVNTTVDLYGIS